MLTSSPAPSLLVAYLVYGVLIVLWNVAAAGRIVHDQRAPRALAATTAFGALLLIPAMLVSVSTASVIYGRAIQPLAWLWPAVTLLFLAQAILALGRRLVSPLFGVPVLAYNAIIAAVAVTRYLNAVGLQPPSIFLALSAAQATAVGVAVGPAALWSATWLLIPLFSPVLPSRSRLKAVLRAMLAVGVTAATALIVVALPSAVEAIRSYDRFITAPLQERPAGDFAFGLHVFPVLTGAPPRIAAENDLALSDSLGADAIDVILHPEALSLKALDSLSHTLDAARDDSTIVVVTLDYPENARKAFARGPAAYTEARLHDIDRIARALRPTVILPAREPYGEGSRTLGTLSPEYWIDYLSSAARVAHHVNPNIKIGIAASSYGPLDSTLYAWAARRGSAVDWLGFAFMPGAEGGKTLDTDLRIAQRWMRAIPPTKPHWIWTTGGYPITHGERSQQLALRGVLSWATAQPMVRGAIVMEAGDYDAQLGLKTPTGRLRPAAGEFGHAIDAIRESAAR